MVATRIQNLGTENAFKVGPHITKAEAAGRPVIRLNLGEPDFDIPEWVKEEVKRQLDLGNTHYCDPKGLPSLRTAIAEQISTTRGIDADPECVVVFPGLKPALGFAQEIYCNEGDEIIYPSPGFPIYESFVRYIGAEPRPLHLSEEKGFTFSASDLAELITQRTRLIYLNFPSNPTGGVASKELLAEIAEVIRAKAHPELRIFSDEVYEQILFDGATHHSIVSEVGMRGRTIVASGFSKTFAWTGGRIGYALLPNREEAELFKQLNINYFSCTAPYNQEGARVALTDPRTPGRIAEMVATFKERRDAIVERLNQIDGVQCRSPSGAFYLWPNITGACERIGAIETFEGLAPEVKRRTSPSTLVQMFAIYHHGVAVMDRRSFCAIGSEGEHFLRLSVASELPQLEEGVRRLAAAFDDRENFLSFVESGENLY